MPQPNILYLHSHDTGRYVQPYGYGLQTPAIQRLATEGVHFRQAFCAGPTCSPSRAAMLTGQWPHSTGMLGLAHRGFYLKDYSRHLVHTLRKAGYTSTLIGFQHIAHHPEGHGAAAEEVIGYDRGVTLPSTAVKDVAPAAAEFLKTAPEEPFFLSVGFSETHRKFPDPGPDDNANVLRPPTPFPDTAETREDMARFQACVRTLDNGIDQVLTALADAGLAENTLVICTTDHGVAFPQMKCNLTDHGTGVMLILRGPGPFQGGKALDAMVSQVDLFPSLCEYLDIEPPEWLDGVSFMPVVRGETQEVREELFSEITFHAAPEPTRAIRTQRYKYIRRFEPRDTPVLPNVDDCITKDYLLGKGWRDQPHPDEMLFDLVFDPHEVCNLAGQERMADVLTEMRGRLDRFMRETNDPLLAGSIEQPEGTKINDPDGQSPGDPAEWKGGFERKPPQHGD